MWKRNNINLTHNVGTREDKLTCLGANKCNCWRHPVASACTRGSWWSCIIAQAHRNDERAIQIVVVFPKNIYNIYI